jgi:hypothetical protein
MDSSWVQVSVRVASRSLTAKSIAEAIGAPASRMFESGQPLSPRSSSVHSRSGCIFSSPLPPGGAPQDHIAWAVAFLRGARAQLARLGQECEIDMRLGFSSMTGQGAFALTPEELALFGELGVQLNVDLYPAEPGA